MKNREAQVLVNKWQSGRRKTQFEIIQEQRRATNRKPSSWVARPRLVQPKAAVRVSASHKKPLWKGNQAEVRRGLLSGLGDDRVCKGVFQSYSNRTREHKLPSIDLAEWIVG